jgi:hypothetical protein
MIPPSLLMEIEREFQLRGRQANVDLVDERLWRMHRVTAWRMIKKVMTVACVIGTAAMPKGLRHGFGVAAYKGHAAPSRPAHDGPRIAQDDSYLR